MVEHRSEKPGVDSSILSLGKVNLKPCFFKKRGFLIYNLYMATEKLFWADPYIRTLSAQITSVTEDKVTLNKTIIYAFSGGQQSDEAIIGGYNIIKAEKAGKEIVYTLPQGHAIKIGDTVQTEINWTKRYRIMRLHFAAELVLELIYQKYKHPYKSGANITDQKARLDFVWDGNISETFPTLQAKLDKLTKANLPITSAFSNEEEQLRYWEIPGFAKVPCGGTHIKKTSEVGMLTLRRKTCGKGKERIEIYLED